jgi:hypothetical protein
MKAVRTHHSLPPSIRELALYRMATVLKCWNEWGIYELVSLEAELSEQELMFVKRGPVADGKLENELFLNPTRLAVVKYADSMALDVRVPEDV